jgi:hypothetical protein
VSLVSSHRIFDFRFSIFDCRIEELEMSEEARGWEHEPTVAFFFLTRISRILDFRFSIAELKNWK